MTEVSRRKLLVGLGCLIAAPAIVRASSLMKINSALLYRPHAWYDHPSFVEVVGPRGSNARFIADLTGVNVHDVVRIKLNEVLKPDRVIIPRGKWSIDFPGSETDVNILQPWTA